MTFLIKEKLFTENNFEKMFQKRQEKWEKEAQISLSFLRSRQTFSALQRSSSFLSSRAQLPNA